MSPSSRSRPREVFTSKFATAPRRSTHPYPGAEVSGGILAELWPEWATMEGQRERRGEASARFG